MIDPRKMHRIELDAISLIFPLISIFFQIYSPSVALAQLQRNDGTTQYNPFSIPNLNLLWKSSDLLRENQRIQIDQNLVDDLNSPNEDSDVDKTSYVQCQELPHSNYLSEQDLDRACEHRKMWIQDRMKSKDDPSEDSNTTTRQKAYLKKLEDSRRVPSFLPHKYLSKAKKNPSEGHGRFKRVLPDARYTDDSEDMKTKKFHGRKSIRKEIRMLSDAERANFFTAVNVLKSKFIDNISIWDLHTIIHYPNSAVAAHWGPAFLPWHREFLRQFEKALQNEVPELVGLPYWDETLDSGLPEPADSVLWTEDLLGDGNGYVKSGPFRDWDTNVLMPLSPVPINKLYRAIGSRPQDRLLSQKDAEWILSRQNFSELTFCHDKTFESMHGLSHVWVGGFMFVIRVSPNDPIFYLHHSFIDNLWEQFRQKQQNRRQRELDYARKVCNKNHGFNAQMSPFSLSNRDGLSNDYTDFWFEYELVRHCSSNMSYCDSKYYFCDKAAWKCRSRVQLGGNCTGFIGTDICFESICIQNICRLPATEGNGFQRQERRPSDVVWVKTLLITDENRALSSGIAHITVVDETTQLNTTSFMQRNPQYPELPGLMYLPLPNPRDLEANNVTLVARDHYGRYCQSYCLNATIDKYRVCEPHIMLKSQMQASGVSNISYTHQFSARKFLDMDMSLHPTQWKILPPFMIFSCHRKIVQTEVVRALAEQITPPMELSKYVWFRVSVLKKPRSTVALDELQIESDDQTDPSDLWISSLRRARSAYDQSVVFVRARNPRVFHQGVSVRISIRHEGVMFDCDVRCNEDSDVDDDCDSTILLHEDHKRSQEQVFTSDPDYLPYLGWRMIGHPSEWRLEMPYLSFYC